MKTENLILLGIGAYLLYQYMQKAGPAGPAPMQSNISTLSTSPSRISVSASTGNIPTLLQTVPMVDPVSYLQP